MKYQVLLTRDTSESVVVEVEAVSDEEALEVALDMYRTPESANWVWETDDWAGHPYVTSVDEVEEADETE